MSADKMICFIILARSVAFILNKILATKVKNRNQRLGLQVTTYIIFVLFFGLSLVIGSLHAMLDDFIDDKIVYVENQLNDMFPDMNIMETEIDTAKLVATLEELNQITSGADSIEYGFIEQMVISVFINKLTDYIYITETNVNQLANIGNDNGMVTIKDVVLNLKAEALDAISLYWIIGQSIIVLSLFIYIGIYIGIVVFLNTGGGMYNKSIVFGEGTNGVEKGMEETNI
jgi:hypothetical protein